MTADRTEDRSLFLHEEREDLVGFSVREQLIARLFCKGLKNPLRIRDRCKDPKDLPAPQLRQGFSWHAGWAVDN